MLEVRIENDTVTLLGDGSVVAAWDQAAPHEAELHRSHDGTIALVAVDELITAVRLADGAIAAQARDERGIDATFPLDAQWTLELAGELRLDRGHTGFQGRGTSFWFELGTDPALVATETARMRSELVDRARTPFRRRIAFRHGTGTIVAHDATVAPAHGGEVLLWPPIAGPSGVLVRHAIVTDDGHSADEAPQPPWLVRADGTVTPLPFELGVSPLLALPGDRWLLPGYDTVWRDDYDEPLCVLDAAGRTEPWLAGGEPLPPSRILREVAPELLRTPAPDQDVSWETVAARVHNGELLVAVRVDEHPALIVGTDPIRIIARSDAAAVSP